MAKAKRTKYVKTILVNCDDFEITDDEGAKYHPHAGEWIKFRSDMPWDVVRLEVGMTNAEYCPALVRILKRQIRDWNWTDDEDRPLPKPDDEAAFEAILWQLSDDEYSYLSSRCWGRDQGEA